MPRFHPFPGLRYSPSHVGSLADVVCPPYDVISEPERVDLEARSPSNVVRVELPRDDGSGDRYQRAAGLLDAWRDGGILRRDPEPALYGYRMHYPDPAGTARTMLGVVGALGLEPPGAGILPHEETTPKAKSDRLALLRAARANVSPIWALSPTPGLSAAVTVPAHPAERVTDSAGVVHELWPVTDAGAIAAMRAAVEAAPVLIADGHHRYETALVYRDEQQAANGDVPGDHDAVMALVVELAEDQLRVRATHRLLSGLPAGFDVVAALDGSFDLTPTGPPDRTISLRMDDAGALTVLTRAGAWLARPRPSVEAAATHDLDSSRWDVADATLPPHHLSYQHGWDYVAAAVASGSANAGVLLRPATVAQIAAIGQGGMRMPPKTTFFWPKPLTGLVIRELLG